MGITATELSGFGLKFAGRIGAAAVVDEDIATGRQQLAADGEADTLCAGGDEGALALELMHGKSEDAF